MHNAGKRVKDHPEVPAIHRVPVHFARRFHQVCLGALAEVTEPEGLVPLQYGVLVSIDDAPGLDQRQLAERLGIDQVSAHHHIGELEQKRLVERRVNPSDRRARELRLAPRGIKVRKRLRAPMLAAQERILSALSQKERANLVDLLARIIESNESYAKPGNGRRRPTRKIAHLMK